MPSTVLEEENGQLEAAMANKVTPSRPTRGLTEKEASQLDLDNVAKTDLETQQDVSQPAPLLIISKNRRRGMFARVAFIPEVKEPVNYTRRTKWLITFIVAAAGAAAPIGSGIIMPSLLEIARELHTSPATANLSAAIYMLAMSVFPLWWSSFSETLGRRTIYIVSFALFVVFAVLSAISKSISMLIVMRLLSGGAAASVQAVGAGTIADIWEPVERGKAMGIFYLGGLAGPFVGPIIGGGLALGFGWRSTQWFLAIYGVVIELGIIFLLPETLKDRRDPKAEAEVEVKIEEQAKNGEQAEKSLTLAGAPENDVSSDERSRTGTVGATNELQRISTQRSVAAAGKTWLKLVKRIFLDPLRIILLLRFPAVAVTVYYASITFGTLYFLNISIEDTFARPPYNFSSLIVGLLYIPSSVGYCLASIIGGRWLDYIMKREARKAGRMDADGNLIYIPEDRMRENAWIAAVLYPLSLLWYGWSVQYGVHWVVPMVANFFFGVGSMIVFGMVTTMLTEFMSRKASTGIAVNNFVRNIFSFVGAVIAAPLIHAIGNGWMCTILCVVSLVSGLAVVWSMQAFGPHWRKKMDHAAL